MIIAIIFRLWNEVPGQNVFLLSHGCLSLQGIFTPRFFGDVYQQQVGMCCRYTSLKTVAGSWVKVFYELYVCLLLPSMQRNSWRTIVHW